MRSKRIKIQAKVLYVQWSKIVIQQVPQVRNGSISFEILVLNVTFFRKLIVCVFVSTGQLYIVVSSQQLSIVIFCHLIVCMFRNKYIMYFRNCCMDCRLHWLKYSFVSAFFYSLFGNKYFMIVGVKTTGDIFCISVIKFNFV